MIKLELGYMGMELLDEDPAAILNVIHRIGDNAEFDVEVIETFNIDNLFNDKGYLCVE